MNAPTVYFLQIDPPSGPVKIGFTKRRVEDRVAEGQTFSPDSIRILVESIGSKKDEARLHRRFAHLRIRGEWFELKPDLQDLILYLVEGGNLSSWLDA